MGGIEVGRKTWPNEMPGKKINIELPEEIFSQLCEVSRMLGIGDPAEAAVIAIAQWVSRRKSELDDRDPQQRYFINEALDELIEKKK
ncbi:MAG TPA: hypothetical protein VEF03_02160 [Candidatus Binataceae bacterium]|nr:hypothetical protein [Candidatus Binataceae bacterium]